MSVDILFGAFSPEPMKKKKSLFLNSNIKYKESDKSLKYSIKESEEDEEENKKME